MIIKNSEKISYVEYLYPYELGLFKFNNNLLPAYFNIYIKSVRNVHNYHTRSSEIFFSYLDLTAK